MQEILCAAGASQRPIILFPPIVRTHHEDLHSFFLRKLILHAFQKKVVPAQSNWVLVELGRGRTEIDVADLAPTTSVAADDHYETLTFAGCWICSFGLQTYVVTQSSALEKVVP